MENHTVSPIKFKTVLSEIINKVEHNKVFEDTSLRNSFNIHIRNSFNFMKTLNEDELILCSTIIDKIINTDDNEEDTDDNEVDILNVLEQEEEEDYYTNSFLMLFEEKYYDKYGLILLFEGEDKEEEEEEEECVICYGTSEEKLKVSCRRCKHNMCIECIRELITRGLTRCPMCREELAEDFEDEYIIKYSMKDQ